LRLTSDRFGLEPEITARLAQWGARIYEVPISYHGRTYAEGKNIGWRDGLEALWLIFKYRFLDTKATNDDSVVTRQALGKAPRFRRWALEQFDGFLGQRVLEVNAGPGHTTSHLLDRTQLVVTDSDLVHVETLRRRFGHLENLDVSYHDFDSAQLGIEGFDTAVLFDGLQRTDDPKTLLANVAAALTARGHILIQVPADRALFGPTDRAAGHVRRFEKEEVADLVRATGLELLVLEPFNRLGVFGWRWQNAMGSGSISPASARTFDWLVPLARRVDSARTTSGLSWLAVARVP
jgi:SAM-dependent methyltransferase